MNSDDLIRQSLVGGIWKTPAVEEQPTITLLRWSIWEASRRGVVSRHFVGWNQGDGEGRVSSPIVKCDPLTRRGTTESGRVYALVGPPGMDSDAVYVWQRWQEINHARKVMEVTDEAIGRGQGGTGRSRKDGGERT